MPPESTTTSTNQRLVLISAVALLILLAAGAFYYYGSTQEAPQTETAPVSEESLGVELYQKSQNPLGDKLPEGQSPVSNPIDNAYKNPFE